MEEFGIASGPLIGTMLRAITEAQVTGQVQNRMEALAFASNLLRPQDR